MLRVFIGYDERETAAFHVLAHSILSRASRPVSIIPLAKRHLPEYTRPRAANESTDFSLTRFMVPYLCGYEGYAVFMDLDMLCLADIWELMGRDWSKDPKAVWVCKHDYTPKSATKFLGNEQTTYRCKNWSSLMVFNNAECRALTPKYVNTASGLALHQFFWLGKDGEERVGPLPLAWNWLVGEYPPNPQAKILHYTLGGPWFEDFIKCDHAQEWYDERAKMLAPAY